jgi:peptidyl-tRNA hydrolase
MVDWVTGRLSPGDLKALCAAAEKAAAAVEELVGSGIEYAMNKFNGA